MLSFICRRNLFAFIVALASSDKLAFLMTMCAKTGYGSSQFTAFNFLTLLSNSSMYSCIGSSNLLYSIRSSKYRYCLSLSSTLYFLSSSFRTTSKPVVLVNTSSSQSAYSSSCSSAHNCGR